MKQRSRRIKNRIISFAVSAVLAWNCLPLSEFPGFKSSSVPLIATAYELPQTLTDFGTSPSLNNNDLVKEYTYRYQTDPSFAADHKRDNIIIVLDDYTLTGENYFGIGTKANPFEGTLKFNTYDAEITLTMDRAVFGGLSDKAKIVNTNNNNLKLDIKRTADVPDGGSAPVLADYVVHSEGHTGNVEPWKVSVSEGYTTSGAIGSVCENAIVNIDFTNSTGKEIVSNASDDLSDAGAICGRIGENATVKAKYSGEYAVISANGNAGGLVGTMAAGSTFTFAEGSNIDSIAVNVTAKGNAANGKGFAGGLVGDMASNATAPAIGVSGEVKGTNSTGGLYGKYAFTENKELNLGSFDNITATVYGLNCGGLYGELNAAGDLKITGNSSVNITSGEHTDEINIDDNGYFGGVIGKLTADLANTIEISDLTIDATSQAEFKAFGGVIGKIDSVAYVKVNNLTVTASGTDKRSDDLAYFGGVLGATNETNGVMVDLGNFTLTVSEESGHHGGGVVGQFYNGVLRLSGTTDLSAAKTYGTASTTQRYGQLIGTNGNVLVYAKDSSWVYKRHNSSVADDLGVWGEVVRVGESKIATFDETAHTVTLKAPVISMSGTDDFVLTALNMQLNNGTGYNCLLFADKVNTSSVLKAASLTLSGGVDLSNTGITGFMRDGGKAEDIGEFSGTLNGGGYTVTLAVGQVYSVNEGQTEGVGQIYRHPYSGLFSVVNGGTVNSLTIDGDITVRNAGMSDMNIGGIAAKAAGNITLNGITAKQTVNYHEQENIGSTETGGKNIGGVIGSVTAGNVDVTGTNSLETKFVISGHHESWNASGSLIGKITASAFTVDVTTASGTVTDKHSTDMSGVTAYGDDADGEGLIGYITSNKGNYSGRKVTINNLTIDGASLCIKANKYGGGLFGYTWLDTDTVIDGVTVKNTTITNNAPNLGAMVYNATGVWKVNKLDIQGLTISGGAGTSLGMIVNKAYNSTYGLYLEVLNSGYTYTTESVTIPDSGIYDEIAAYSATNQNSVLMGRNGSNAAGVISIVMGDSASVAATGTYQNKLDKTMPNANTRYYYNVSKLDSSNGGQNLLLWSLNKYASTNINGNFVSTISDDTLTGNADLTGLSFYPVYLADGVTIEGLTMTFDYNGILVAEQIGNTDSYTRDPGDNGTGDSARNQHYLMQSGLFVNLSAGSDLTFSGALNASGTFMETDTYQGFLISGTSQGNINTTGGISLNGITPYRGYTTGTDVIVPTAYTDGYLLINNIVRDDAYLLTLNLYNISTGTGYTAGTKVAKSLIGTATGKELIIDVKNVKLDGRNKETVTSATTGQTAALNTAYHTTRSIFSQSILFEKINTTKAAQLTYNFTWEDDWGTGGRNVTYGSEITESVEYANKEKKYSGDIRINTNPLKDDGTAYSFTTDFLPYVFTHYTTSSDTESYNRELKVNVVATGLTAGCGTYNDPYIITDGEQLEYVAAFLKDGKPASLGDIKLPKTAANYDTLAENTTGDRWCDDKTDHDIFTPDGDTAFKQKTTTDPELAGWTNTSVQWYLASAYYKINSNITLSADFVGLGGTTANTAFRGVIVGSKNDDGTPKYTITNQSVEPFIKVSNGSVVKDIDLRVNASPVLYQSNNSNTNAAFIYNYDDSKACKFYGGMFGEIMGGDNIIDNSYVTFAEGKMVILTKSGDNGRIVPVGAYVGVVVFGGVIFKNIDARKTTIASTGFKVTNPQIQGKYAITFTGNAEEGDTFTVAGRTYTVQRADLETKGDNTGKATPSKVVDKLNTALNGHADYTTSKSGGVLTLIERDTDGKKGVLGAPEVSTTSETTTFKVEMTVDPNSINLADSSNQEAWSAIYVNPLVGRVINGYAVNETGGNAKDKNGNTVTQFSNSEDGKYHDKAGSTRTGVVQHTLKNGKKHYSIADIDPTDTNNSEALKLDVKSVPTSTTDDGVIDVPNAQALFVLSLITQSTAGTAQTAVEGDYNFSLSYGTNTDVYGTNHIASYLDVGTSEADKNKISDFINYAASDTAANTAVPYIIEYYTKIEVIPSSTTQVPVPGSALICDPAELGGKQLYIENPTASYGLVFLADKFFSKNDQKRITAADASGAVLWNFERLENGNFYIYTIKDSTNYYLKMSNYKNANGHLELVTEPYEMVITLTEDNTYTIRSTDGYYLDNWDNGAITGGFASNKSTTPNANEKFSFHVIAYEEHTDPGGTMARARCVTSTLGYYDINLTGDSYVLPDSFRGLGSVGYYDNLQDGSGKHTSVAGYADRYKNRYSMKVDVFNGNSAVIDEDIYINKFLNDNYFNVLHNNSTATQAVNSATASYSVNNERGMHGIGLFDSIVMRDSDSVIKDFELSGSVNTAVYNNKYAASAQEVTGSAKHSDGTYGWLVSGGVVGHSLKGTWVSFDKINLKGLKMRGNSCVGGLLGFSINSSDDIYIVIKECSANDISIEMSSVVTDSNNPRSAAGAFVGKVYEGGVKIYGTALEDNNTVTKNFKTVTISEFSAYTTTPDDNSPECLGGLVGYAGNGCYAYDMHIEAKENTKITIGNTYARMAGGIVGLVQPCRNGVNGSRARAVFKNCQVKNINIQALRYAGGLYGGTTGDHSHYNEDKTHYADYSTYQIIIQNCKMIGEEQHNTIIGGYYAGGFVGDGFVVASGTDDEPNITVSDCMVSNYNISSYTLNYVGGFIGYCGAPSYRSIIASVYNSSVENCILGDANDYTGGVIGYIYQGAQNETTNHKIAGYNVKLDNVTTDPGNTTMGAWIGKGQKTDNSTISVQLSGIGVYGNGFANNIGDGTKLDSASFVFADYNDTNADITEGSIKSDDIFQYSTETHEEMPKYPYVNISPQGNALFGDKKVSSDGAVMNGSTVLAKTIYDERTNNDNARQYYTTFEDTDIVEGVKLSDYFARTTSSDGDRISTFNTETGNTGDDLPVVVIANTEHDETTALINRYIQIVTNTTDDYADEENANFHVDISQWQYSDGGFTKTQDKGGIKHESGKFKLDSENADSRSGDSITLLDVQFYDPLKPSAKKIVYHLYVPVYTVKEINVKFYAVAKTGTQSNSYTAQGMSDIYTGSMNAPDFHADNLNTWYTHYIRYEYDESDINAMLRAGKINWNYRKQFDFATIVTSSNDVKSLPTDTYLILVDPNGNSDQAYFGTIGDLETFESTGSYTRDSYHVLLNKIDGFTTPSFAKIISRADVTVSKVTGGRYDEVTDEERIAAGDYDITTGVGSSKRYFKVNTKGEGGFALSVTGAVYEDYYLSMKLPIEKAEEDKNLYYYDVAAPARLDVADIDFTGNNPQYRSAAISTPQPTSSEKYVDRVLVANLFEQHVHYDSGDTRLKVTDTNEQMTASHYTLTAEVSVKVTPINEVGLIAINGKTDLYHSFYIQLVRFSEQGEETDIQSLDAVRAVNTIDGISSNSTYTAPGNYINIQTTNDVEAEGLIDKLLSSENGKQFEITSSIILTFDSDALADEFPGREAGSQDQWGVNIQVHSNLAYESGALPTTTMTEKYDEDSKYYYVEKTKKATLRYSSKGDDYDEFDDVGKSSQNKSTLGVNGISSYEDGDVYDPMPVNTEAFYNWQAISINSAKTLRLKLSLEKKTDVPASGDPKTEAKYVPITQMENYLKGDFTIKLMDGKEVKEEKTVTAEGGSITTFFDIVEYKPDNGYYDIQISFNAKTGGSFKEYANYNVKLSVDLMTVNISNATAEDNENVLPNSVISDHVVYTNAKVREEYLSVS